MTINECKEVHEFIANDEPVKAANHIFALLKQNVTVRDKASAVNVQRDLLQGLLDNDRYLEAAVLQWGANTFQAEPESVVREFEAMKHHNLLLFMGASSMGKCLGPDVKVMKYDGSIIRADEVKVGDRLMGDDSKPRRVLFANSGFGQMYKISPERGEPWTCNDAHILSLRTSTTKTCGNSGKPSKKTKKGLICDVPIKQYLAMGKSRKSILKQFHVGVEFPKQSIQFDPYIYGSWLGDGGTDVPALHTPDGPMARRWVQYFSSIGYRIHAGYLEAGKCPMWCARWARGTSGLRVKNPFLEFIRSSVNNKEKFIRHEFMINSRENRINLLAGLIDSDGWVNGTSYGFISKFRRLADQVMWLARSLGFAAVVRTKIHRIKSIGFSAPYHTVQISGKGVSEIPTLEKRAIESQSSKVLTNTGFSIEPIGPGDYFGFVIDGNHRFLLGDFTVTHNTYGVGAWMLLDYLRDPLYTSVKLGAVNEDHLRKNLFAHVANLQRACCIPSKHDIVVRDSDLWMGIKEAGNEFGISGIAFKQSQDTSGQFKGYKAKPVRKKRHPRFGYMGRLRVLGDEGQNWPGGPFKDFNSLIASISGPDLVKIAMAFNPESVSCHVVQLAEPVDGWNADQMETLYDYESKSGWWVCRLDAARSENVIQKRIIYPGLQTYEGYMGYLKSGGDNSANYSIFARGFPPMRGSVNTIIPPSWPQDCRGEAVFVETPMDIAAVDLAFMGKDAAQMAVGRWGLASGYRDQQGQFNKFKDRLDMTKEKPRHVLQLDQLLPMQKHDNAVTMAEEIMGRCKALRVKPENCAIDTTGIGFGTGSHLRKAWGDVFTISWNEKATERKILAEDNQGADKQVEGVMSEMWWALRQWMNPSCRAFLINPIVPSNPIHTQFTSRRYDTGKNGIKVESKDKYKARNQNSPDEADAIVMLLHLVRHVSGVIPGLVEQSEPIKDVKGTSSVKFMSVKDMANTEESDSISADGEEDKEGAIGSSYRKETYET